MTTAIAQLRALLWLRWQMVRSPGLRFTLYLTPVLVIWLLQGAIASPAQLTQPALYAAVQLAPAAFLGFGLLALVAPLAAGGGVELIPSDQLVAYPVRPRTVFLGALLLAPVNLVWVMQLLILTAETAYLTLEGNRLAGALLTIAYILCLTISGQAVAWVIVGLRQTRAGRRAVAATGVLAVLAVVAVTRLGLAREVLDGSPTVYVVHAIEAGPGRLWWTTALLLAAATVGGVYAGSRTCAWALRRPAQVVPPSVTAVTRRRPRRSAFAELVSVDRASVWRAVALRRGALVLALLPGLAAVGTAIPWQALIVLPGLVAAGAGLLFGVNAFCLDGSGAIWLASLPHDPAIAARAKLAVLNETVAGAVLIALFTGSLRSPGTPTLSQLTALVSSALACAALVIATCISLSVHRPHRADLRGPRDAIAPPGALTAASARLALPAAGVGMVLEAVSAANLFWLPPLLATPVLLASLLWLRRSLREYASPVVRARVLQSVSAG